jgi:hypothetical protein
LPTPQLVQVIDFVQWTWMPVSVVVDWEEPPRGPNFVPRWPFQLGKPLIRQELVYKLRSNQTQQSTQPIGPCLSFITRISYYYLTASSMWDCHLIVLINSI